MYPRRNLRHDRDCDKCNDGDSCYEQPARDERPVDLIEVAARDLQVGDRVLHDAGPGIAEIQTVCGGVWTGTGGTEVDVGFAGGTVKLSGRVLVVRDRGTP